MGAELRQGRERNEKGAEWERKEKQGEEGKVEGRRKEDIAGVRGKKGSEKGGGWRSGPRGGIDAPGRFGTQVD